MFSSNSVSSDGSFNNRQGAVEQIHAQCPVVELAVEVAAVSAQVQGVPHLQVYHLQ